MEGEALRFRGGWRLLMVTALLAGACSGNGTAESVPLTSSIWSRVPHDEVVFGGGRN